jgi:hypothetical protein
VGDAAVEPLLAILRTRPRRWPEKAALVHAARLVGELRPPAAIPELVSIIRRYIDKPEEQATESLARFGTTGFEVLLELFQDPSIDGHRRVDIAAAAKIAAGDDSVKRARLADVLRPRLEQLIAIAREEKIEFEDGDWRHEDGELLDQDVDEPDDGIDEDIGDDDFDDDWDDDLEDDRWLELDDIGEAQASGEDCDREDADQELKPVVFEDLAHYVGDLADLADPLSVDLIKAAYEEELIGDLYVDREEIDELYRTSGFVPVAKTDWLETYRKSYDRHLAALDPPVLPPPSKTARLKYRYEDRYEEGEPPPDVPATAPIRNTAPRLGRNDPCWCGSGKKYKKCHLGKETQG